MRTKNAIILATLLAGLWSLASTVPSYGFAITYNANVEQLLFTSSDAPPQPAPFTPGDCPDCPFTLTNNTGTTWTDFHFRLVLGPESVGTFFFVSVAFGGYDGDVYEDSGGSGYALAGCCTLDVVALNIPTGEDYTFTVDMDAFELLGTYQLLGTPTTDGGNGRVPLPGTFLLVAVGLAGFASIASRRGRKN
jgi:hypothetical protein